MVLILRINLLNLSWIKISIFEEYEAFKEQFDMIWIVQALKF